MYKRLAIFTVLLLPTTGCTDAEILDVASSIGTSNAVGEPATVYARVARTARSCWFKPDGLIKNTHMFYAEVAPKAEGGRAEISVRKRRKNGKPGDKAYIVSLAPAGENTLYNTRNISFDEIRAAKMTRDVHRWANAELGCHPSTKHEWAPEAPKKSANSVVKPKTNQ